MRPGGIRNGQLDNLLYGIHYGVVTNNDDENKLDRVKVKIPSFDKSKQDETYYCRYVTPMTGNQFGWYALPDVDDVVAIMFLDGDTNHPIVLGGVWSTKDEPPEPNEDQKNNFRGYRSRIGHRLILDDSGKVKVVFTDQTGKHMVGVGAFDKDGKGPNVCAVFKPAMAGSEGVSFSAMTGDLKMTAKKGIKVTAGKAIKINAKTTIDMKASKIELSGSVAKLTASALANYDASSINIG